MHQKSLAVSCFWLDLVLLLENCVYDSLHCRIKSNPKESYPKIHWLGFCIISSRHTPTRTIRVWSVVVLFHVHMTPNGYEKNNWLINFELNSQCFQAYYRKFQNQIEIHIPFPFYEINDRWFMWQKGDITWHTSNLQTYLFENLNKVRSSAERKLHSSKIQEFTFTVVFSTGNVASCTKCFTLATLVTTISIQGHTVCKLMTEKSS